MNKNIARVFAIFAALFLLCLSVSVPLTIYTNKYVETKCQVLNHYVNESNNCAFPNCGVLYIAQERKTYNCTCYNSYVRVHYLVDGKVNLGLVQVQSNLIEAKNTEDLSNYYANNSVFACYYNKFSIREVYAYPEKYWWQYLVVVIMTGLGMTFFIIYSSHICNRANKK